MSNKQLTATADVSKQALQGPYPEPRCLHFTPVGCIVCCTSEEGMAKQCKMTTGSRINTAGIH